MERNKPFDLYKYKTCAGAAKALYRFLLMRAREMGYGDREVFIRTPLENELAGYGKFWHVSWESGPHEWAVYTSGGGSMYGSYRDPPEIKLHDDDWKGNGYWHVEPYYSFDLTFYPE
jgi:hypothetical protein